MSFSFDASVRLGRFQYSAAFDGGDELVVLFGHSGAGKSITLQLFAGLLRPDAGRIVLHDRVLTDTARKVQVPPEQRGVGYVVQELALFPHMTVAGNVAFGIPAKADRDHRLAQLLHLLSLEPYRDRRPGSLSGGQRQRVALARALARDAEILLLDEPFSALDESLRQGMRRELLRLRRELGLPIIFVTHDLREAHLLADRLAVFDEGKLLQYAPRDEVFRRPLTARVAELTGVANILAATVVRRDGDLLVVQCQGIELEAGPIPGADAFTPGQAVHVAIRAERVNFRRIDPDEGGGPNMLRAAIVEDLGYGSVHAIQLRPEGAGPALHAEIASRPYEVLGLAGGGSWTIELPPADIHVMPA